MVVVGSGWEERNLEDESILESILIESVQHGIPVGGFIGFCIGSVGGLTVLAGGVVTSIILSICVTPFSILPLIITAASTCGVFLGPIIIGGTIGGIIGTTTGLIRGISNSVNKFKNRHKKNKVNNKNNSSIKNTEISLENNNLQEISPEHLKAIIHKSPEILYIEPNTSRTYESSKQNNINSTNSVSASMHAINTII